jgi:bifunctional ADP-heptose synthase (sugar kinase/adenylyltransferase)
LRPFIAEQRRAELACALAAVDAVTFFDEDTPRELIAAVLPDILIKGADWAHFIAGREEVEAAGGQVLALPLEPGYSTTGIVEKILARTNDAGADKIEQEPQDHLLSLEIRDTGAN